MKGKTQQAAAAASDMSERSVRNWNVAVGEEGQEKEEGPDPFAGLGGGSKPLLEADVDRILVAQFSSDWTSVIPDGIAPADAAATIRDWRALRCTSSRNEARWTSRTATV